MSLGQLWTFLGVALPVLAALLVPMPSVDLTYQLRAGGYILAGFGIPTVDTWTFTAGGAPWLDQQWGAQAVLAGVFEVAGWTGLAVLRAALVGSAFWFARSTLRAYGCGRRPATVLTLLSFIVAAPALALRPQLLAIVLFAATMWILAKRREHPRRLWLIPVIAVAWANLHGSFPLVVVLVALGWLDEVMRARSGGAGGAEGGRDSDSEAAPAPGSAGGNAPGNAPGRLLGSTGIALIGAVAAVATLVTPFGIDTWRYVANLAANPAVAGQVSEWRPPSPLDPAGAVFYVSVLAVLVVVALRMRAEGGIRRERLSPIATVLAFGALGVVSGRGLAWWALVAPVAAANLAHEGGLTEQLPRRLRAIGALFRDSPARRSTRGNRLNSIVAAVLILAGVALLPFWRPVGPLGVPAATVSYAPEGIAAELRDIAAESNPFVAVWNPQVWGSWLEWAEPSMVYLVDSRIELFPPGLWNDIAQFGNGGEGAIAILDTYKVRVVVLTAEERAVVEPALDRAAFILRYEDADGSIWVRTGTTP